MPELDNVRSALAFGVSAISAEHFFSAGMSSPWSVSKFAESDEDKAQVWKLFWVGAGASAAFAVALAAILGNSWTAFAWALAGAGAVIGLMWWEYDAALKGTL